MPVAPRILLLLHLPLLALALPALAGPDWPGFRGPATDGAVRDARLFDGTSAGLVQAWKVPLGPGYASLAVGGGRVFAMHGDVDGDWLAAFAVATGERLWRYRISDPYKGHDGSHDGPIATPWLHGDRVYGLSAFGHLFAVDAATGEVVWTTHLVNDLGAEAPWYGFAASPRMIDGVLVVELSQMPLDPANPPAEPKPRKPMAVAGFDPATGRSLWIVGDDHIEYQSPTVATLGGVLQVLVAGKTNLLGIEPKSGRVLWTHQLDGDDRAMGGLADVPVIAGDDRVFLKHKIDTSVMLRVAREGDTWKVSELWSNGSISKSYVVPVYHEGYLYGMNNRVFTCVDAATGEVAWRSREPGDGFPILVGKHLVMMTKPGSLHVIEADPTTYRELAKLELFGEHSWSEPAFADGSLYARSMGHLARVDLVATAPVASDSAGWVTSTVFGRFLAALDAAPDKKAAIDAFLAAHPGGPIVEDDGSVHFVYRGPAQDVGIVGDMIGFRREDPMTRVAGTDLFHYSTRLEPDAAVAYGFIVDYAKAGPDPRNSRATASLFGDVSWFSMPAWEAPDFLAEAPPARRGRLEPLDWPDSPHKIEVYLPAGYAEGEERYPVAYFHSGNLALERGQMKNVLDQLIGTRVAPLIAVFVHEPAKDAPRDESPEAYTDRIVNELIPRVDARYRTIADARGRASLGFGGTAEEALGLAFEHPDLFRRVGVQSPMIGPGSIPELVTRGADVRPMVVYHDWGTYHQRSPHEAWSLVDNNRQVWAALRAAGYRPAGGERPEGFGWPIWIAHTDEMLAALFPPGSRP